MVNCGCKTESGAFFYTLGCGKAFFVRIPKPSLLQKAGSIPAVCTQKCILLWFGKALFGAKTVRESVRERFLNNHGCSRKDGKFGGDAAFAVKGSPCRGEDTAFLHREEC
jgi:hypothetical protein